jgi:hypothetical protein
MKRIPIIVILLLISLFFIMLCRYNQKNIKNEMDKNEIEEAYNTTPTISTKYNDKDIRQQNLKKQQLQQLYNQLQQQLKQLQEIQKQEAQIKDNKRKLQLQDQKLKINKMIKELNNKINILK